MVYFVKKEEKVLDDLMGVACRLRESILLEYEEDASEYNRLSICAIDLVCDLLPRIYHSDEFNIKDRYVYEIFDFALVLKVYKVLLSINLTHENWNFDKMNTVINEITTRIFIEYLL